MGYWVVLEGPQGRRKVLQGKAYRPLPGEVVVGSEWDSKLITNDPKTELQEVAEQTGLPLGDIVKKAIELIPGPLRPRHCSKCEERRLALNRVKQLGVKETIQRLREIG